MKISDVKLGEYHHSLLKGIPGTGKSIAAHSYPEPIYTFDIDRKMNAVAAAFPKKDIEFENFENIFEIVSKIDKFRSNPPDKKTIIFDGISTFAELCMSSIMEVRAPGKKRISVGKGSTTIELYQIEDYNAESRAIKQVLDDLKYISSTYKINVICIVHIMHVVYTDIIEKKDKILEGLYMPGTKISFAVPVGFDETYEFRTETSLDGNKGQFMCYTTGQSGCKTTLKVPDKINWTGKNFYTELSQLHERESKVLKF